MVAGRGVAALTKALPGNGAGERAAPGGCTSRSAVAMATTLVGPSSGRASAALKSSQEANLPSGFFASAFRIVVSRIGEISGTQRLGEEEID